MTRPAPSRSEPRSIGAVRPGGAPARAGRRPGPLRAGPQAPGNAPAPALVWGVAGLVVLGWGVNFVFAKHVLDQVGLGTFNFVRFVGMACIGWLVIAVTGTRRPLDPGDRLRLGLVALVGFCGYVFGFSVGLSYTSAFSASLLLALVPLWLAGFTAVAARRRPGGAVAAALAVALAGTVVFVTARTSVALGWGDLVSLAVAGAYAGYLLLSRPLVGRYPPFTLTTYAVTVAAVPVAAATLGPFLAQDWSALSATGLGALVWVVVMPVFVAWSVWSWVLRHLEPGQVAPLLFLVPVISGITSTVLLAEPIAAGQWAGTALVVAGLALNHRATTRS